MVKEYTGRWAARFGVPERPVIPRGNMVLALAPLGGMTAGSTDLRLAQTDQAASREARLRASSNDSTF